MFHKDFKWNKFKEIIQQQLKQLQPILPMSESIERKQKTNIPDETYLQNISLYIRPPSKNLLKSKTPSTQLSAYQLANFLSDLGDLLNYYIRTNPTTLYLNLTPLLQNKALKIFSKIIYYVTNNLECAYNLDITNFPQKANVIAFKVKGDNPEKTLTLLKKLLNKINIGELRNFDEVESPSDIILKKNNIKIKGKEKIHCSSTTKQSTSKKTFSYNSIPDVRTLIEDMPVRYQYEKPLSPKAPHKSGDTEESPGKKLYKQFLSELKSDGWLKRLLSSKPKLSPPSLKRDSLKNTNNFILDRHTYQEVIRKVKAKRVLWLYGNLGQGKTELAKYIVNNITDNSIIDKGFVSCGSSLKTLLTSLNSYVENIAGYPFVEPYETLDLEWMLELKRIFIASIYKELRMNHGKDWYIIIDNINDFNMIRPFIDYKEFEPTKYKIVIEHIKILITSRKEIKLDEEIRNNFQIDSYEVKHNQPIKICKTILRTSKKAEKNLQKLNHSNTKWTPLLAKVTALVLMSKNITNKEKIMAEKSFSIDKLVEYILIYSSKEIQHLLKCLSLIANPDLSEDVIKQFLEVEEEIDELEKNTYGVLAHKGSINEQNIYTLHDEFLSRFLSFLENQLEKEKFQSILLDVTTKINNFFGDMKDESTSTIKKRKELLPSLKKLDDNISKYKNFSSEIYEEIIHLKLNIAIAYRYSGATSEAYNHLEIFFGEIKDAKEEKIIKLKRKAHLLFIRLNHDLEKYKEMEILIKEYKNQHLKKITLTEEVELNYFKIFVYRYDSNKAKKIESECKKILKKSRKKLELSETERKIIEAKLAFGRGLIKLAEIHMNYHDEIDDDLECENNYLIVLSYFKKIKEGLEKENNLELYLKLLISLGGVYRNIYKLKKNIIEKQDYYQMAITIYNEALNISQKIFGPMHLFTAKISYYFGKLHHSCSQTERALSFCNKAKISQKISCREDLNQHQTAKTCYLLGQIYINRNEYPEAQLNLEEAIRKFKIVNTHERTHFHQIEANKTLTNLQLQNCLSNDNIEEFKKLFNNNKKEPYLLKAVAFNALKIINVLLKGDPSLAYPVSKNGEPKKTATVLHKAVTYNHCRIIEYLVKERKCDINAQDEGGYTPLHMSAYMGYLEATAILLSHDDIDINKENAICFTALDYARDCGFKEIIKLLEAFQKEKTQQTYLENIPKKYKQIYRQIQNETFLKDKKENKNFQGTIDKLNEIANERFHKKNENNYRIVSMLHFLLDKPKNDKIENAVVRLIRRNIDTQITNFEDQLPLHFAAKNNYIKVFRALTNGSAAIRNNLTALDKYKQTPIHIAASNNRIEILERCIHLFGQQSLNIPQIGWSWTPLHQAAIKGHVRICQRLLKNKLNRRLRMISGIPTEYHKTMVREGKEILLIKNNNHDYALGFKNNDKVYEQKVINEENDKKAYDLLIKKIQHRKFKNKIYNYKDLNVVINKLMKKFDSNNTLPLELGVSDFTILTNDGWTALHEAVLSNSPFRNKIINMILDENQACINMQEEFGETALFLAVKKKHVDTIRLLVQRGANIHIKNEEGISPLIYVQQHKLKYIERLFRNNNKLDKADYAATLMQPILQLDIFIKNNKNLFKIFYQYFDEQRTKVHKKYISLEDERNDEYAKGIISLEEYIFHTIEEEDAIQITGKIGSGKTSLLERIALNAWHRCYLPLLLSEIEGKFYLYDIEVMHNAEINRVFFDEVLKIAFDKNLKGKKPPKLLYLFDLENPIKIKDEIKHEEFAKQNRFVISISDDIKLQETHQSIATRHLPPIRKFTIEEINIYLERSLSHDNKRYQPRKNLIDKDKKLTKFLSNPLALKEFCEVKIEEDTKEDTYANKYLLFKKLLENNSLPLTIKNALSHSEKIIIDCNYDAMEKKLDSIATAIIQDHFNSISKKSQDTCVRALLSAVSTPSSGRAAISNELRTNILKILCLIKKAVFVKNRVQMIIPKNSTLDSSIFYNYDFSDTTYKREKYLPTSIFINSPLNKKTRFSLMKKRTLINQLKYVNNRNYTSLNVAKNFFWYNNIIYYFEGNSCLYFFDSSNNKREQIHKFSSKIYSINLIKANSPSKKRFKIILQTEKSIYILSIDKNNKKKYNRNNKKTYKVTPIFSPCHQKFIFISNLPNHTNNFYAFDRSGNLYQLNIGKIINNKTGEFQLETKQIKFNKNKLFKKQIFVTAICETSITLRKNYDAAEVFIALSGTVETLKKLTLYFTLDILNTVEIKFKETTLLEIKPEITAIKLAKNDSYQELIFSVDNGKNIFKYDSKEKIYLSLFKNQKNTIKYIDILESPLKNKKLILTCGDSNEFSIWDYSQQKLLKTYYSKFPGIYSGKVISDVLVLLGKFGIQCFPFQWNLFYKQIYCHYDSIFSLALLNKQKKNTSLLHMLTAGKDSRLCVWDVDKRKHLYSIENNNIPILHIFISETKNKIICANADGSVKLFSSENNILKLVKYVKFSDWPITKVMISADEKNIGVLDIAGNLFLCTYNKFVESPQHEINSSKNIRNEDQSLISFTFHDTDPNVIFGFNNDNNNIYVFNMNKNKITNQFIIETLNLICSILHVRNRLYFGDKNGNFGYIMLNKNNQPGYDIRLINSDKIVSYISMVLNNNEILIIKNIGRKNNYQIGFKNNGKYDQKPINTRKLKNFQYLNGCIKKHKEAFNGQIYTSKNINSDIISLLESFQIKAHMSHKLESISGEPNDPVYNIAYDLKNEKVAYSSGKYIFIVTINKNDFCKSCKQKLEGHQGNVRDIKFTQDNQLLSVGEDQNIMLWQKDRYYNSGKWICCWYSKPSLILIHGNNTISTTPRKLMINLQKNYIIIFNEGKNILIENYFNGNMNGTLSNFYNCYPNIFREKYHLFDHFNEAARALSRRIAKFYGIDSIHNSVILGLLRQNPTKKICDEDKNIGRSKGKGKAYILHINYNKNFVSHLNPAFNICISSATDFYDYLNNKDSSYHISPKKIFNNDFCYFSKLISSKKNCIEQLTSVTFDNFIINDLCQQTNTHILPYAIVEYIYKISGKEENFKNLPDKTLTILNNDYYIIKSNTEKNITQESPPKKKSSKEFIQRGLSLAIFRKKSEKPPENSNRSNDVKINFNGYEKLLNIKKDNYYYQCLINFFQYVIEKNFIEKKECSKILKEIIKLNIKINHFQGAMSAINIVSIDRKDCIFTIIKKYTDNKYIQKVKKYISSITTRENIGTSEIINELYEELKKCIPIENLEIILIQKSSESKQIIKLAEAYTVTKNPIKSLIALHIYKLYYLEKNKTTDDFKNNLKIKIQFALAFRRLCLTDLAYDYIFKEFKNIKKIQKSQNKNDILLYLEYVDSMVANYIYNFRKVKASPSKHSEIMQFISKSVIKKLKVLKHQNLDKYCYYLAHIKLLGKLIFSHQNEFKCFNSDIDKLKNCHKHLFNKVEYYLTYQVNISTYQIASLSIIVASLYFSRKYNKAIKIINKIIKKFKSGAISPNYNYLNDPYFIAISLLKIICEIENILNKPKKNSEQHLAAFKKHIKDFNIFISKLQKTQIESNPVKIDEKNLRREILNVYSVTLKIMNKAVGSSHAVYLMIENRKAENVSSSKTSENQKIESSLSQQPKKLDFFKGLKPITNIKVPNEYIIKRKIKLDEIEKNLQSNGIAAVTQKTNIGRLGGVGKTALAQYYAYNNKYQIKWLCRTQNQQLLLKDISKLAKKINERIKCYKQASLVRIKFQNQKTEKIIAQLINYLKYVPSWLLILDDVKQLKIVYNFMNIVSAKKNRHIITTSQENYLKPLDPIGIVKLSGLEESEILKLLNAYKMTSKNENNKVNIDKFGKKLNSLPLTLTLACHLMKAESLTLLDFLNNPKVIALNSTEKAKPKDYLNSITTVCELNLTKLKLKNAEASHLLYYCAHLAPDEIIPPLLLERVLNCNLDELRKTLKICCQYGLLNYSTKKEIKIVNVQPIVQQVLLSQYKYEEKLSYLAKLVRAIQLLCKHSISEQNPEKLADPEKLRLMLLPHIQYLYNSLVINKSISSKNNNYFGLWIYKISFWIGYINLRDKISADSAKKFFNHALTACEKALGDKGTVRVAKIKHQLGATYFDLGNLGEAKKCYEVALSIKETCYGKHHLKCAETLIALATIESIEGKPEIAEKRLKNTLEIYRLYFENDHEKVADGLYYYAINQLTLGKASEARLALKQVKKIRKKKYSSTTHWQLVSIMEDLTDACLLDEKPYEAKKYFKKIIATGETSCYMGYALYLFNKKKYTKSLSILEDMLGKPFSNCCSYTGPISKLLEPKLRKKAVEKGKFNIKMTMLARYIQIRCYIILKFQDQEALEKAFKYVTDELKKPSATSSEWDILGCIYETLHNEKLANICFTYSNILDKKEKPENKGNLLDNLSKPLDLLLDTYRNKILTNQSVKHKNQKEISRNYWYEDHDMKKILECAITQHNYKTSGGRKVYILGPIDNISHYSLIDALIDHKRKPGTLLIPFNKGGLHWVGLVLEFNNTCNLIRANYYDPLRNNAPNFLNYMLKVMSDENDRVTEFTDHRGKRTNQATKKLNREGLSGISVKKLRGLLKLPEELIIGTAVKDGGCGFDALAQCLDNKYTEKKLRMLCHQYYLDLPEKEGEKEVDKWIQALEGNNPNIGSHYLEVQHTGEELKNPHYPIKNAYPTWFVQEIDGRVLCKALPDLLSKGIHVIEVFIEAEGTGHYHITEEDYRQVSDENEIKSLYNCPTLLLSKKHFVPLLRSDKTLRPDAIPAEQHLSTSSTQQVSTLICQTNGSDCGPCTIENLLAAIGYREPEDTTPQVRRQRHLELLEKTEPTYYTTFYQRQRLNKSTFSSLHRDHKNFEWTQKLKNSNIFSMAEYKALLQLASMILALPEQVKTSFKTALQPEKEQGFDEHRVLLTKIRSAFVGSIDKSAVKSVIEKIFYVEKVFTSLDNASLKLDYNQFLPLSIMLALEEKQIASDLEAMRSIKSQTIPKKGSSLAKNNFFTKSNKELIKNLKLLADDYNRHLRIIHEYEDHQIILILPHPKSSVFAATKVFDQEGKLVGEIREMDVPYCERVIAEIYDDFEQYITKILKSNTLSFTRKNSNCLIIACQTAKMMEKITRLLKKVGFTESIELPENAYRVAQARK